MLTFVLRCACIAAGLVAALALRRWHEALGVATTAALVALTFVELALRGSAPNGALPVLYHSGERHARALQLPPSSC